jgi:FkbM family methyltransferase
VGIDVRRVGRPHYRHVDPFVDQRRLLGGRRDPTIFDVGANRGQTTQRYLDLFPNARILAFEPSPDAFTALKDTFRGLGNVRTLPLAVADGCGTATLFRNADDVTDSLLAVAPGSEAYVDPSMTRSRGTSEVSLVTLDAFCEAERIDRIAILKMDIQGAELRALRGASRLLATHSIDLIYSEVLFSRLYEGQTRFCDMHGFLEERGYSLYGLYNPAYGRHGRLGWADALYAGPGIRDDAHVGV